MAQPIRLRPLNINGIRVDRQVLPEQFRAYCTICGWGGEWRSAWKTWDYLVWEISEDLKQHLAEVHV